MGQVSPFPFKTKIFADGADPKSLNELAHNPSVKGFTTNPSLMRTAGISDYKAFCLETLKQIQKPISFEVFADEYGEMKRQALEIASWGDNVYVKIPISDCEGGSTSPLINELSQQGVKINVTAILTLHQVAQACQAVQGGAPSIISVFAGRIADTGRDPVPVMAAARALCEGYGDEIELLWASTREIFNIIQADEVGCHIITVPPSLLSKLDLLNRDLSEYSLDTVRMFKKDADKAGFVL